MNRKRNFGGKNCLKIIEFKLFYVCKYRTEFAGSRVKRRLFLPTTSGSQRLRGDMREIGERKYRPVELAMCSVLFMAISYYGSMANAGANKPEWFEFYTVTVQVYDYYGSPAVNTQVHAFSEDWGTIVPKDGFFTPTDQNGTVQFILPGGRWSIIAAGGDGFTNGIYDAAFFVFVSGVDITSDATITLQPDTQIDVGLRDTLGAIISIDEIWCTSSKFSPAWRTTGCGHSGNSFMQLQTVADQAVDLAVLHRPQPGVAGYLWTAKGVSTSGAIDLNTAGGPQVVFDPRDAADNPTEWNIEFRLPNLDMTAEFNVNLNFIEPTPMVFNVDTVVTSFRFIRDDWYLYFVGDILDFSETVDDTVHIGGPLTMTLRIIPEGAIWFPLATQLWFDVQDAFNHRLSFHGATSGTAVAFQLRRDGEILYDENLPSRYTSLPEVFDPSDNLYFEASMDFGEFGILSTSGDFWAPEFSYNPWGYESTHFRYNTPSVLAEKNQRMVGELEEMYDMMMDMTAQPITSMVDVNIDITGQGFPGEEIPLKAPLVVYLSTDHRQPAGLGFMYHEMGHVRLLKEPLSFDPIMEFGESGATLIGNKAIALQMDSIVALRLNGVHDKFFYHLQGEPLNDVYDLIETAQFILSYVEKIAGWEAHREMLNRWTGDFATARSVLSGSGYNDHTAMAVLYSCAAQTDLGWLFELAGFAVVPGEVTAGLELIGCPACDCGTRGDMNCDGRVQPIDVTLLINLVYRDRNDICNAPQCPFPTGDLDCNGFIQPVDVVYLINFVYRSRDNICDGCDRP